MGDLKKRLEHCLAGIVASMTMGAAYFALAALLAYGLVAGCHRLFPNRWDNAIGPEEHVIILMVSSLLAFVAIQFQREKSLRGRGNLEESQANSTQFVRRTQKEFEPLLLDPRSSGEKLYQERPGDYWAKIIADGLVRLAWFSIVTFYLLYRHLWLQYRLHHPGTYERHFTPLQIAEEIQQAYRAWDGHSVPEYVIWPVVAGVLAALLCPWMKNRAYNAGRNLPWRKPKPR